MRPHVTPTEASILLGCLDVAGEGNWYAGGENAFGQRGMDIVGTWFSVPPRLSYDLDAFAAWLEVES